MRTGRSVEVAQRPICDSGEPVVDGGYSNHFQCILMVMYPCHAHTHADPISVHMHMGPPTTSFHVIQSTDHVTTKHLKFTHARTCACRDVRSVVVCGNTQCLCTLLRALCYGTVSCMQQVCSASLRMHSGSSRRGCVTHRRSYETGFGI
jgi:hypothetical protein